MSSTPNQHHIAPPPDNEGQGLPMPVVVAACFIAGVVVFLLSLAQAHAETPPSASSSLERLPPSVISDGGLFIPGDDDGSVIKAPLLKTELTVDVSGLVARYTIRHHFENPTADWTEAIYTFPLPDDAAVDRLQMSIGDRVIEGEIKEKEEAKRAYEKAKAEGRKSSLLAQHRPNIFSTSLANIGPQEHVTVEIGFQEILSFSDGRFQLSMPLVVGPRYIPGPPMVADLGNTGWALAKHAEDTKTILPPVRDADEARGNPISLVVRLDPGFPMGWIDSPSHLVTIEDAEGKRDAKRIQLALETEPQDRDFILNWGPKPGEVPHAGAFKENVEGENYSLVMVLPPVADDGSTPARLARAVTFVIDTSGSMHGPSIEQAKAALNLAIDRLKSEDQFNVIAFSSDFQRLFSEPQLASSEAKRLAHGFVSALKAEGGTEMLPALNNALSDASGLDGSEPQVSQVLLITDGAIGNEQDLFTAIAQNRGAARVFAIGIGSAPNSYLMSRAAQLGQGSATHISRLSDVGAAMTRLFGKLENPAMTDIQLTWPGGQNVETYPATLPDLYAGEPLIITAKLPKDMNAETLYVSGRLNDRLWSAKIKLDGAETNPGIAAIWGRAKIRSAMADLSQGSNPDAIRTRVVETALTFKLLSQYTSLVAIDDQVTRPPATPLRSAGVPVNMPEGWSHEAVFGTETKATSTPPQRRFQPDQSAPLQEAMQNVGAAQAFALPQGATPSAALTLGGVMLLTLSLILMIGLKSRPGLRP